MNDLRWEISDSFKCEYGHRLYKIFEPGQKYVHHLLCKVCDREQIQKLEQENKTNGQS
jgi:hypothetical protein